MKNNNSPIQPCYIILLAVIGTLSLTGLPLKAQQPEWTLIRHDSTNNLTSLSCADADHCFALGFNGNSRCVVYRTTNGGLTWDIPYRDSYSYPPLYLPQIMFEISHPTTDFAIAVGDSGVFTRTTDAGKTWTQYHAEGTQWRNKRPVKIAMCDERNGILCVSDNTLKRSLLYHTADGGLHWDSLPIPAPSAAEFSDIVCFSPRSFGCFLDLGKPLYKNYFARSDDTGKTWELTPQAIPVDTTLFYPQMCFIDSLRGWMSMGLYTKYNLGTVDHYLKRCVVWHTTDGGRHWQKQLDTMQQPPLIPMNSGLESISFADSLNGLAVGEWTVFRTTNGGNTWTFERLDTTWLHGTHHVSYRQKGKELIATLYNYIFVPASRALVPDGAALPELPNPISVFPNPAPHGQHCRVRFSLQQQAHVRISVYDVTGCTVRALPDQIFEAGSHTQELSIEGLPPGQYFGRVIIGTQIYVQSVQVQ